MTVKAELPYLALGTPASLHSTGALFTERDADGTDHGVVGVVIEPASVDVLDGRAEFHGPRLDSTGIDMVPSSPPDVDFLDDDDLRRRYLPACCDLVASVTGAERVFAFDYNVRASEPDRQQCRIRGGQRVQGPARVVHGDYTLDGSRRRLLDLAAKHDLGAALSGEQRWRIVNVWRNRSSRPVVNQPLALCDGKSIRRDDLAVFEIRYPNRIGENYFAKPSPEHRWWWYPELTRQEAILIKQWDSHGAMARTAGMADDGDTSGPCTFSLHTAFTPPDKRPGSVDHTAVEGRQSIEVRCLVLG